MARETRERELSFGVAFWNCGVPGGKNGAGLSDAKRLDAVRRLFKDCSVVLLNEHPSLRKLVENDWLFEEAVRPGARGGKPFREAAVAWSNREWSLVSHARSERCIIVQLRSKRDLKRVVRFGAYHAPNNLATVDKLQRLQQTMEFFFGGEAGGSAGGLVFGADLNLPGGLIRHYAEDMAATHGVSFALWGEKRELALRKGRPFPIDWVFTHDLALLEARDQLSPWPQNDHAAVITRLQTRPPAEPPASGARPPAPAAAPPAPAPVSTPVPHRSNDERPVSKAIAWARERARARESPAERPEPERPEQDGDRREPSVPALPALYVARLPVHTLVANLGKLLPGFFNRW